jgi:hypothetical protein
VVLLAIVARVGTVVGLPDPSLTAASDDNKSGRQAIGVLAPSLTPTGVDTGEVVDRVFDGEQFDRRGPLVRREEKIASITKTTRDGGMGGKARKGNHLDEHVLTGKDGRVTKSVLASVGDGRSRTTGHSAREAIANDELAGKTPAVAERKTKRRKKGNAIDELFAGLS